MARPLLLASAAGKIAAVLLWPWEGLRLFSAALFFAPDLVILYHIFVPSAQGLCRVFTHFDTPRAEIWLTIDDGPDEKDTPRILDLLEHHRARATFFLIGERAERFPGLVAEILRRGHDVGHHTHTHPSGSFWCATPSRVSKELDDGLAALARSGARPRWFRAPVGIKSLFLAKALSDRGLACAGWSVRSYDSVARDPARVVKAVMRRVRSGSIVLMHEGPPVDRQVRVVALQGLLESLADQGFECVVPSADQLR